MAETRFQLISAAYERLQNPAKAFAPRDQKYYDEIQRRRAYAGFSARDMEFRRQATQAEARAGSLWQRDEGLFFVVAILVSYDKPTSNHHPYFPHPGSVRHNLFYYHPHPFPTC